ncbi:bifunctional precorrin-2 dehydrogenase/sirohydrochlorin ferrochelatase [uncultured Methanosphaera sp.]|uniref:precorrin-2 dehydrogenase/sirohydrochlorin ferrochelatase family protein n=1 Tax=uncultured Methanosphaera sp. TaxID=262501 RepID=UPI0025E7EBA9|nr:bifunctional precorrin-2 dehydrogenase/sirohydrochlorin ferrochelatase [uncultured Methanosphaera sp.]
MGLTSLFLDMKDKNVLIVGTGSVGIRRGRRFLDTGANVSVVTKYINNDIKEEFIEKGAVFYDNSHLDELIDKCDIVVAATSNHELNKEISIKAKDKLVNCASDISLSNVIVPSTFNIGSVTVSLYTGSKSPLMAKQLRKKIQSVITEEDIMNIELQEHIRTLLKKKIEQPEDRKEYLTQLYQDEHVQELIKENNIVEAKEYVNTIIKKL